MENDEMTNGWHEWSKHVLKELERLNDSYEKIEDKLNNLCLNYASFKSEMKVKSSMWGAVGGIIPIVVLIVVYLITKYIL